MTKSVEKKHCEEKHDIKLCWVSTIGPKWQIVIPKELREMLWIHPWDSFAVVLSDGKYIAFVRNQDMSDLMSYIQKETF